MTDLHTRALVLTRAPGEAFDPATRTIPVVASTEAIDSYDEVIDQASWRLARFQRAPLALWQHCSWEEPIGFYRNVRVEGGALRMDLVLYEGAADPEGRAERVLQRYAQGGPVSVSVGFMMGRSEREDRGGRIVRVLYDNELHEVSVVTVGANPDAVALRARAALRRARKGTPMTFEEYLKERGMTPAQAAAACGMTEDQLTALVGGAAPTPEQVAALAAGLGLSEEEVAAMFPAPAAEAGGEEGGEEPAVVIVEEAAKARAELTELRALLGVKDHGAARARIKALLHLAETSRKTADERAATARRRDELEVAELLRAARTDGRVTGANEAKVAEHLKGAAPSAVRAYLDTLVPLVDPDERREPADGSVAVSKAAAEIGARVGFTPEKLAAAAAENERRRAQRTPAR
jgi:HK97 family phage prohead protease